MGKDFLCEIYAYVQIITIDQVTLKSNVIYSEDVHMIMYV